jgi:nickel/cobalt transporter (NicO) family protein
VSFLALATSALGLGFLHGLGADHLMAIAALSVDRKGRGPRVIMRTAVGFAVGHAAVLGLGAVLAVGLGLALPVAFEAGAERLGGVLLVALGLAGLWSVASGRAFGHAHAETDGRLRWHLHLAGADHPHAHSRVPAFFGAVFALSSLRALMFLEPFGASAAALAVPAVLALVVLFSLGILMSMSLFGVILARVISFSAIHALGRLATTIIAAASILLGAYWIVA